MSTITTVGDLVSRVHRLVKGSRREIYNLLATDLAASSTATTVQFSVTAMDGITEGSYLGIGNEIVYVTAIDTSAASATVIRAMFDTDPDAHVAGDLVEVDWRWFTADVLNAMTDDVRSWPENVYAWDVIDVAVGNASTAVDLPTTNFRFVLDIRRSVTGKDRWVSEPADSYRVDVNLPTSSFPSGNALYLPNLRAGIGTVRVTYAQEFGLDAITLATLLADIPLSNTLIDVTLYGAAWRLLVDDESQRSNTLSQPEPRQAQDVREGSAINTGGTYKKIRDMRLAEEASRLRGLFPYRFG